MQYLFQLGHSPVLAGYELDQYLRARKVKYAKTSIDSSTLIIETKAHLQPNELIKQLGGTVRIALVISQKPQVNDFVETIVWQLAKQQKNRVEYGISFVGNTDAASPNLAAEIKSQLIDRGLRARFVNSLHGYLQPIILKTQPVTEFIVVATATGLLLAETIAVTDVLSWQKRDRQRPEIDSFSGVLPPKAARMMLNLALKSAKTGQQILDPFCGSGTILMESLLLGHQSYGVDISPKAVADTQQNLEWLGQEYVLNKSAEVITADVTTMKLADLGLESGFDAIVTEAYLGPSRFTTGEISQIIAQLKSLYEQTLDNLTTFLKPKSRLVIAFPQFSHSSESSLLQQFLIDTSLKSGYTQPIRPIVYGQLNARVKRMIYTFDLNK